MKTVSVQTRAADEPAAIYIRCADCPIDASRSSFACNIIPSALSSMGVRRTAGSTEYVRQLRWEQFRAVASDRSSRITQLVMHCPVVPQSCDGRKLLGFTTSVLGAGDNSVAAPLADVLIAGDSMYYECVIYEKEVGPKVFLQVVKTGEVTERDRTLTVRSIGTRREVHSNEEDSEFPVHSIAFPGEKGGRLVRRVESDSERSVLDALRELVPLGLSDSLIRQAVPRELLSVCLGGVSRSYDAPKAPDSTFLHTAKVDGIRAFGVLMGSVWVVVTQRAQPSVLAWRVADCVVTHKGSFPVVDCEVMASGCLIAISLESPTQTPRTGDLPERLLNSLATVPSALSTFIVRDYFAKEEEASLYARTMGIPCDGLLAVSTERDETLKLKTMKSIELLHQGNGTYCTDEGQCVSVAKASHYPVNSIVEFRIVKEGEKLVCKESFVRHDKRRPNGNGAVQNILRSMQQGGLSDDIVRSRARGWCSDLRIRLFSSLAVGHKEGRVLVDVGCGDGQSATCYTRFPNVPILSIDPDPSSCHGMSTRLGMGGKYMSVDSVVDCVSSTSSARKLRCVLCCTLAEFIRSVDQRKLWHRVDGLVCSFSMSYVLADVVSVSTKTRVVGCGYFYDGIGIGEKLVDVAGASMEVVSESTALVRWGKKDEFTEPAVTTRMLNGRVKVVNGVELLAHSLPKDDPSMGIVSKVRVVHSRSVNMMI